MYSCIYPLSFSVDSYGTSTTSSSTPDDRTISSVVHNSSSDKEEHQEQTEDNLTNNNISNNLETSANSDKVISETAAPSPVAHLSDKNLEFESALYSSAVDNFFTQNNIHNNGRYDFHASGVNENHWPYDLSRTAGSAIDNYQQSASNFYSATNFRNHYTNSFYNQVAMKGNLMTFNNPLSPPSSSSSSSSESSSEMPYAYYCGQDNNNSSSFINYHENNNNIIASQTNIYLDDFCEILKEENYYSSVEDSGHYTTLQNAASTGSSGFDMYIDNHIPRNFGHQHSTSSGDSRSPSDAFNATDDYDTGMQNFTQLTQLTTRSNGLYASSPITDGMISNYDSTNTHGLASNK